MNITRTSMLTGITRTIDIPVTPGQIARWQGGTLIQTAMPDLSADDREFIMTGITGDEWDAHLNSEEDQG